MVNIHYNPTKLILGIAKNENQIEVVCFKHTKTTKKISLEFNLAEKSRCRIIVLAKVSGGGSLELITSQNHSQSEATSDLLCKALVADGEFIYRGGVYIAKSGNLTHAYQRNENLLLSSEARVVSEPSLEILANDVYCTHGAATSPLDDEQLYYLQTRGLSHLEAANLLERGFLLSGLDRLLIDSELVSGELDKLQGEVNRFFFK